VFPCHHPLGRIPVCFSAFISFLTNSSGYRTLHRLFLRRESGPEIPFVEYELDRAEINDILLPWPNLKTELRTSLSESSADRHRLPLWNVDPMHIRSPRLNRSHSHYGAFLDTFGHVAVPRTALVRLVIRVLEWMLTPRPETYIRPERSSYLRHLTFDTTILTEEVSIHDSDTDHVLPGYCACFMTVSDSFRYHEFRYHEFRQLRQLTATSIRLNTHLCTK
jgi:hypothetical protein